MSKVQCNLHHRRGMGQKGTDDFSDVAERIFHNINTVFQRDDSLDEFDIVPVESKSNRSPVIHIDHKLAVESWCVPFLYTHSFRNFICLFPKRRLSSTSLRNESSCSRELLFKFSALCESERIARALQLSRTLILLNPDLALAWNFRRDVFDSSLSLKTLESELQLISLTATRKPKCPEGFSYRRWLVKKGLETQVIHLQNVAEFFESEATEAEKSASKYFSNYHAWNYRLWLLELLLGNQLIELEDKKVILNGEFTASNRWIESHVSDYSGFHYRQKILEHLNTFKVFENMREVLKEELVENHKMILLYKGHESLWNHRRAVLSQLISKLASSADEENSECNKEEQENLMKIQKEEENHLVKLMQASSSSKLTENTPGVSMDCSQLNTFYAERHSKWLRMSLKWDL